MGTITFIKSIFNFIDSIVQWASTQDLWIQVFLGLVGFALGFTLFCVFLSVFIGVLYYPPYLLARYLGFLSIFIIIPTLVVMITENGEKTPPSDMIGGLVFIAIICGYGFIKGLGDRSIDKDMRRRKKINQQREKTTSA